MRRYVFLGLEPCARVFACVLGLAERVGAELAVLGEELLRRVGVPGAPGLRVAVDPLADVSLASQSRSISSIVAMASVYAPSGTVPGQCPDWAR